MQKITTLTCLTKDVAGVMKTGFEPANRKAPRGCEFLCYRDSSTVWTALFRLIAQNIPFTAHVGATPGFAAEYVASDGPRFDVMQVPHGSTLSAFDTYDTHAYRELRRSFALLARNRTSA